MPKPRIRRLISLALAALCVSSAQAERPDVQATADGASEQRGEDELFAPEPGEPDHVDEAALLEALAMLGVARHAHPQRQWSNGPRAVARARGAALARALSLGIGDHEKTRQLLWSRPGADLMATVPGPAPKSLLWPVVGGKWGRGFGFTRKVRVDLRHNGIDIGAPAGTPVRAAADGLVLYSDNTLHDLGNAVMILHPGGYTTLYAHCSRTTVQPGYYVKRGERIALIGQTGAAWGPHLHFELRDNGRWIDPEPLIVGYRDIELAGPTVALDAASQRDAAASSAARTAETHAPESHAVERHAAEPPAPEPPAPEPATADRTAPPALPLAVGTLEAARRLLQSSPPRIADDAELGRRFSNLLYPLKGGRDARAFEPAAHRAVDLAAEMSAPVRAAADGVVVYSGEGLVRGGRAIVVWHRGGWVTLYGCVSAEGAAPAGARVLRGEWIGHVGACESSVTPALHFEWLDRGERRDPSAQFVGR
jgi:murein DD-endopeptidase MepM/ murein hydrolase activator NlpD